MNSVFVSYVEEDSSVAKVIASGLEDAGFRAWYYERDSNPGLSYLTQTEDAIATSSALLLIISPDSLSSWQVDKEVVRAHEAGKPIIPVLLGISYADFQQRRPDWRMAVGSVTSIRVPSTGAATIMPRLMTGLQQALAGRAEVTAVQARPTGGGSAAASRSLPRGATTTPATALKRRSTSRAAAAAVGVVTALALALVFNFFWMNRQTATNNSSAASLPVSSRSADLPTAQESGSVSLRPIARSTADATPDSIAAPAATSAAITLAAPPTVEPTLLVPPPAQAAIGNLPGNASALVMLPNGGIIERASEQPLPSGSLIKLWIAATVFEQDAAGRLSLGGRYVLRSQDQAPGTGILQQTQYIGRSFTIAELLETMIVYSDNTAANVLIAQAGGFSSVNDFARRNGYRQTLLQRRLGYPDPSRDNFTSARDSVAMLSAIASQRLVSPAASERMSSILSRRRTEEAQIPDGRATDYFGRYLPSGAAYVHLSGLVPGMRNEVGWFRSVDNKAVIVAILLANLPDEVAGEEAIGRAVEQLYRTLR